METITLNQSQFHFFQVVRELYVEECQIPNKTLLNKLTAFNDAQITDLFDELINKGIFKVTKFGLSFKMEPFRVEVK